MERTLSSLASRSCDLETLNKCVIVQWVYLPGIHSLVVYFNPLYDIIAILLFIFIHFMEVVLF